MAYLDIIEPADARGELAEAYERNRDMYARGGLQIEVPNVYLTNFAVPEYLDFGTVQADCLPNYPMPTEPEGPVPWVLINFALAKFSACYY
jgi:hypothetical protein